MAEGVVGMTLQEILSAPQAGFSGLYTPSPMSGTDVVNGAFQEEAVKDYRQQQAQQVQQNLIDRARAEAVREDPTLNFVQRRIAQGLLGAKKAWESANAIGDAAGMESASQAARGLRDQADAIGWDSRQYGPNATLHEAAQAMANNDTMAVNNLLYGNVAPSDYYQKQYNDMLRFGIDRETAEREAQAKTESYHRNRMGNMVDAFHMYGMDDRGAINPNGLRILGMMASEGGAAPSEIASFYSKMLASPQQNWNFENSMLMTDKGLRDSLTKMAKQNEYNTEARREGYQHAEHMAHLNNDFRVQNMVKQAELNIQSGIMSKEAGYNWLVQKLVDAGASDQEAKQIAASSILSGKGSSGSNSNKQTLEMAKELRERIADIEKKYSMDTEALEKDEEYQKLKSRYNSLLEGNNGNSSSNQEISADDAMAYAGKIIQENASRNYPYTKAQLIQMLRPVIGDYVDWIEWGDEDTSGEEAPAEQSAQRNIQQELPRVVVGNGDVGEYDDNAGVGNSALAQLIEAVRNSASNGRESNARRRATLASIGR